MPRPNKGARLYLRRRSGRQPQWTIRDGGHETGTGCAGSEREGAERKLAAYLGAKYRPDFGDGDPRQIPVAAVLTLYAKERAPLMRRPELAAHTIAPLAIFWGDKTVAEVTAGRCRDYAIWRTTNPVATFKNTSTARLVKASTARRELGLLAAALNYAHGEGKLKYPVPVALPKPSPARLRWLTRGEAARLLWAAWRRSNRHVARFILLGLYTGTRHDAILRLRWLPSVDAGWIDLEQGLIYRRGAGESESSKRRPPVPISPRLAAHLRRWKTEDHCKVQAPGLELGKPDSRNCPSRSIQIHSLRWKANATCTQPEVGQSGCESRLQKMPSHVKQVTKTPFYAATENGGVYVITYGGLPVAKMRRAWHSARRAAGLGPEVTPHILRHTFASWAVQAGHSFAKIAAALGTTEGAVEATYAHLSPDALREVVASVAGKGR
jgi:integrase